MQLWSFIVNEKLHVQDTWADDKAILIYPLKTLFVWV